MEQTIRKAERADLEGIRKRVRFVHELAKEHLGRPLPGGDADLDVLQEILDRELLGAEHTFELQCLGAVLGERLAAMIDGLEWAVVEDEHGTDPALRYEDTSLLLFPLTMISKRVEDGTEIDVRAMVTQLREKLAELEGVVSRPH